MKTLSPTELRFCSFLLFSLFRNFALNLSLAERKRAFFFRRVILVEFCKYENGLSLSNLNREGLSQFKKLRDHQNDLIFSPLTRLETVFDSKH